MIVTNSRLVGGVRRVACASVWVAPLAAMLIAAASCADEVGGLDFAVSPRVEGAGGQGGAEEEVVAEQLFRELEPQLISECGSCHQTAGSADTPFLGDPDGIDPEPYDAITSWPGLVVADPFASVLIRWPFDGSHTGPPLTQVLEGKVLAWLVEEAKTIGDTAEAATPTIPPFKPIVPGFNSVYLDALGGELAGMAVSFYAEEIAESALALTTLQLHPTADMGVRAEHPLFIVYGPIEPEGEPDPIDSFSNVVQDVEAGTVAPLGPGMVILTNWQEGGRLSLAFELIEPLAPQGGPTGGGSSPCAAVPAFIANAQAPLGTCAANCHGGGNTVATNAVDMSDLQADPDAACGQVLNRIDLNDPPLSQLFVTTDPAGTASHPFKFGGNQNDHQNFVSQVSLWIQAEAQAQ